MLLLLLTLSIFGAAAERRDLRRGIPGKVYACGYRSCQEVDKKNACNDAISKVGDQFTSAKGLLKACPSGYSQLNGYNWCGKKNYGAFGIQTSDSYARMCYAGTRTTWQPEKTPGISFSAAAPGGTVMHSVVSVFAAFGLAVTVYGAYKHYSS